MAYNAQAGATPAAYLNGGTSGPEAAAYQEYQPYHYQPHDTGAGADWAPQAGEPEPAPAAAPRARFGKIASMLGAAASLALIAGVGVWSYELISRDISGVPVVRAVEGPMRVQPENPGGQAADHQGLAVNAVAATGGAEAPAETLVLAPEDVALTEDDQPLQDLSEVQTLAAPLPDAEAVAEEIAEETAAAEAVEAFQQGQVDALVAELTAGANTMAPLQPLEDPDAAEPVAEVIVASAEAIPAVVPAIVQPAPLTPEPVPAAVPLAADPSLQNAPGVARSLRPVARPARFAPAAEAAKPGEGRATLEVEPGSMPAGTRLAQLGAYESAEVARAEWDRIHGKFPDFLDGKQRVVQRAESGGRIFYRLRAHGFEDLADARRFCSALVAQRADCIPVTSR